jgi:hypothetical protein
MQTLGKTVKEHFKESIKGQGQDVRLKQHTLSGGA